MGTDGLDTHLFTWRADNYGVLLRDVASGRLACVDAGEADAVLEAIGAVGARPEDLTHLLITHHHDDHRAGMRRVKEATGCTIVGSAANPASKTTANDYDLTVSEGDVLDFSGHRIEFIQTPGHTLDMINPYLPDAGLLFTGDTLFMLGCGRLFEGDARMMHASLAKLKALPPETMVFCGHEYTETNAGFALTVDPHNAALQRRAERIRAARAAGEPTVPARLAEELATNPFLRTDDAGIREALGMAEADDVAVFAEIRRRRDGW
ncbi:MAG: hydroxyacylglutathione hydrolase [Gammaproteobacteria bacterium]|nr:MAG: hydroxyacylglutathione hydrolase [Gammaproteobacteria bacterium]PIE35423.1 MAG: hydroxyacylglutathione hydrolase [Gammaproteobacteria bacterium]